MAAITVALLVVGTALVKPWEFGSPANVARSVQAHAAGQTHAAASLSEAPTAKPLDDPAIGLMLCNAPPTWRLITAESDAIGSARTMYTTTPQAANGPADPSIATAELRADHMYAIGVCRPNPAGLRVPDLPFNQVTIWAVAAGGRPAAVVDPSLLDRSLFRLGEAYFGPPASAAARDTNDNGRASWQPGRYVVEVLGATPGAAALWLGLDFIDARAVVGAVPTGRP